MKTREKNPKLRAGRPRSQVLLTFRDRINFCNNVRIPNLQDINSYLDAYPDMISIVQEICLEFVNRFQKSAQLSLELYRNPENEDQYLTLYVRQEKYEEDIMESIEDIMSMFDEKLSSKNGWFLSTTDFQPPG